MKFNKLLSFIMAILMLTTVLTIGVGAINLVDNGVEIDSYTTTEYSTQKARVDKMSLVYTSTTYGYAMYMDTKSAEFAIQNLKTGEYTFSNPYDVASDNASNITDKQKMELLSQIILTYSDVEVGTMTTLNSFENAALLGGQIEIKNTSNGIRVEYAIGTLESKRLIPIWITQESFETKIYDVLDEKYDDMTKDEKFVFDHLLDTYYNLKDQTNPVNEIYIDTWRSTYKCLENDHTMIIYTFQQTSNARALKNVESLIRKYCPNYTYDDLEADHEVTGYEGDSKEPALFRLAIEYSFDENGFNASIPSKSIRYNETNYSLESIKLLPYFGCATTKKIGTRTNTGGYLFIPDGSGTLLSFYKVDGSVNTGTQGSKVYGTDWAYETLSETNTNSQIYRYPVFGIVDYYTETIETKRISRPSKFETIDYSRGFLAIVSEGESFASIIANMQTIVSSSGDCKYDTVTVTFSSKMSDTVNLGNSLGSNSALTTSVDTKYLGNYKITYVLLSDPNLASENDFQSFEPSYVGMANAYRDYLIKNGSLEKLTSNEIETSIPLYIQSFGSSIFTDKFLSIPVEVEKPLTTFENVIQMNEELKKNGITNTRFILTAFANGPDFNSYYPTYVSWRSKLGGANGFKKLVEYAKENDILIFPNFDFANVYKAKLSFSFDKYAAKSMSGRYSTKRQYDFVYQSFSNKGMSNIVSAGSYADIYAKFVKQYDKYNVGNIAVLTLGTDLNSDFDIDDPITREDCKDYTKELLSIISNDNKNVLVSSGNSYTLHYVTDIVDLPLDNSGFLISTNAVPFIGMVLHGYYNYAGSAINMAGDVKYQLLKSIESGAAIYFILSYQNTSLFKDDFALSSYYSVNFDIWKDDLVENYNILNNAIGTLQMATITDHGFVEALRAEDSEASALFSLSNYTSNWKNVAKQEYFDAIEVVDERIRKSQNYSNEVKIETAKQTEYNTAVDLDKLVTNTINRYLIDEVVYVTYTREDGTTKTFYINYNSFDVVINNPKGGISILKSLSFVEENDLVSLDISSENPTFAKAYQGTASQIAMVQAVYEQLEQAILDGNALRIKNYRESLNKQLSKLSTTNQVVCVENSDGSVYFINTTAKNVFVEIADDTFITLAGESYSSVNVTR